jgi:type I restriction-modification system DNA methylase subunit
LKNSGAVRACSAPSFSAQNKIQDPAKLQRLIQLIDAEIWLGLGVDVKGAIYEGLLERNASEVKSGAGQYFTPRPLIDTMIEVVDPDRARRPATRPAAPAASCCKPTPT